MAEKYRIEPYISEDEIQQMLAYLSWAISEKYKTILKPDEALHIIGVLKGGCPFAMDLAQALAKKGCSITLDFVIYSSYGAGTTSSGEIKQVLGLQEPIANRHILAIEDIVDSGRTMKRFMEDMKGRNCESIALCTLLDKPCRRQVELKPDFRGREIPDEFVVGYGLDYNQKHRFLESGGIGRVVFD